MNISEAFMMASGTKNVISRFEYGKFGRKHPVDGIYRVEGKELKSEMGRSIVMTEDFLVCTNWEVFGQVDHSLELGKLIPNLELPHAFMAIIEHNEQTILDDDRKLGHNWLATREAWVEAHRRNPFSEKTRYVKCEPNKIFVHVCSDDKSVMESTIFSNDSVIMLDLQSILCNDWIVFNKPDLEWMFKK